MTPCTLFVPPRVVDATCPPVNCPRLTSYVLVITRVLRTASEGTLPDPKLNPSRVIWFWLVGWPPTENVAAVESVAEVPMTPGASAAMDARSPLSMGSRSSWAADRLRSWLPAVGRSVCCALVFARTWTAASTCALRVSRTLCTRRSSSLCRETGPLYGPNPMKLTFSVYAPPPSGKSIE